MSLQRLFIERFRDSHPHRSVLNGPLTLTCYLILLFTSLLSKKDFAAPMRYFAFEILVSISMSSLSSGIMVLPRYLNLLIKCICLCFCQSLFCLF